MSTDAVVAQKALSGPGTALSAAVSPWSALDATAGPLTASVGARVLETRQARVPARRAAREVHALALQLQVLAVEQLLGAVNTTPLTARKRGRRSGTGCTPR